MRSYLVGSTQRRQLLLINIVWTIYTPLFVHKYYIKNAIGKACGQRRHQHAPIWLGVASARVVSSRWRLVVDKDFELVFHAYRDRSPSSTSMLLLPKLIPERTQILYYIYVTRLNIKHTIRNHCVLWSWRFLFLRLCYKCASYNLQASSLVVTFDQGCQRLSLVLPRQ